MTSASLVTYNLIFFGSVIV